MRKWIDLFEQQIDEVVGDCFLSEVERWSISQGGEGYKVSSKLYRWYNGEWEIEIKPLSDCHEIQLIRSERDLRGQGFGRSALKALCVCADKCGAVMRLQAAKETDWLAEWYGRYGFHIERKARNGPWMIRVPI